MATRTKDQVKKAATGMLKQPLTYSEAVTQIGTTGIKRVGPYIREEYLRELQGRQGRAKYREMYANDVVRRAVRAIKLPMLAASWNVEGAEGPDAEAAQEFVLQCIDDMSHTWFEFMDETITGTTVYGASVFQPLYKRRRGQQPKEIYLQSDHDDGLWGWESFSPRGQETWEGWVWDEAGRLIALRQMTETGLVEVPLYRCVHFVNEGKMGDPNGESMLRAAYEPWYGLRHADTWIGILIERMGGVPIAKVNTADLPVFDPSDPDMVALRAYVENGLTAFRLDEQMGAFLPFGIDFEITKPPINIADIESYIRLCSWRILGSVLAQFLELGQAPQGSYSKSQSDKEFFLLAEEAFLQRMVAETLNRQEIPRLFGMNAGSFRLTKLPRLVPSDMQVPTLAELAEPLSKLVQFGVVQPGPKLQEYVRGVGDLPEEEEEAMEEAPTMPAGPAREEGEEPAEEASPAEETAKHYVAADLL